MCLVDSSTSIDIESGDLGTRYVCLDCDTKFRGIGKKVKCPSCDSANIKKI